MVTFKAGDKLRCVNRDYANNLRLGDVYTVVSSEYDNVVVKTAEGKVLPGFFPRRFQLVKPTYAVTVPAVVKEFDNAEDALDFYFSTPGAEIEEVSG